MAVNLDSTRRNVISGELSSLSKNDVVKLLQVVADRYSIKVLAAFMDKEYGDTLYVLSTAKSSSVNEEFTADINEIVIGYKNSEGEIVNNEFSACPLVLTYCNNDCTIEQFNQKYENLEEHTWLIKP